MNAKFYFAIVLLIFSLFNYTSIAQQNDQNTTVVKGIVIVKVKENYIHKLKELSKKSIQNNAQPDNELEATMKSVGINILRPLATSEKTKFPDYFIMEFDTTLNVDSVKNALEGKDFIDKVFHSYKYELHDLGCYSYHGDSYINDPAFMNPVTNYILAGNQYEDYDMSVVEAWEFSKGNPEQVIAILGGRVYTNAPDLIGHVLTGLNYSTSPPNTNTDPDQNDFYQWNTDAGAHGTFCAKVIAAQHDNTPEGNEIPHLRGDIGIAPEVNIIPYILSSNNITADMVASIIDAADRGAIAYSVSKGIDLTKSAIELTAEDAFNRCGMLMINAIGNLGFLGDYYPPTMHGIAVACHAANNIKSSSSNYGPDVNITANGGHGGETSFSAPAVAAVAALVKSLYPNITGPDLRDKLLSSVDPLNDFLWDPIPINSQLGTGKLDAFQAIATRLSGDINQDTELYGPIYIANDLIIKPGVTVTIKLSPLANGLSRTHVRFATRKFQRALEQQYTKIYVEGRLIIQGTSDEIVLFSNLQNTLYSSVQNQWTGRWGGIVVRNGGSLKIDNAIIENCIDPIVGQKTASSIEITNSEICHYNGSAIYIKNGINSLVHNHIHDGYGWGIVISDNATQGIIHDNIIENNQRSGIACINFCLPRITDNTIQGNKEHGIFFSSVRPSGYFTDWVIIRGNTIQNNGLINTTIGIPTCDGIHLFDSYIRARLKTQKMLYICTS